jgi:hypothetical protein
MDKNEEYSSDNMEEEEDNTRPKKMKTLGKRTYNKMKSRRPKYTRN